MKMDAKNIAMMIMSKKPKKSESEEYPESEESDMPSKEDAEKDASEALFSAIESKDAKAFVDAFKDMLALCGE